jgi:hypothetical protein
LERRTLLLLLGAGLGGSLGGLLLRHDEGCVGDCVLIDCQSSCDKDCDRDCDRDGKVDGVESKMWCW